MSTTATQPATCDRHMDAATTIRQIGMSTVWATSGGRTIRMLDGAVELPVSSGYRVRIVLAANDTYTVQRILKRGCKVFVKGTMTDVYCDELSEVVYQAGCFRDGTWGQ